MKFKTNFAEDLVKKGDRNPPFLLLYTLISIKSMLSKESVEEILVKLITDPSWYIVDIKLSLSKIRNKITILLDTDQGISIDECGEISRKIANELDDKIEEAFVLEVSSPGLDSPLIFPRQYKKNTGKKVKLVFNDGNILIGVITAADENQLIITPEKNKKDKTNPEPIAVSYESIKSAIIQVSFK